MALLEVDDHHKPLELLAGDMTIGDSVSVVDLTVPLRNPKSQSASTFVTVGSAVVSGGQGDGQFALDGAIFAQGNGGAAVVGQYGKVVGMIFRKDSDNRGWAIPAEQILAGLSDLDIT